MATDDRVTTNLRKGLVEFCVLAILDAGSTYGLDLARRMEQDGLIAGESTLYPLMARLLASGLVDSEWVIPDGGRARKYYVLTSEGRLTLSSFTRSWPPLRDAVDRTLRKEPQHERTSSPA